MEICRSSITVTNDRVSDTAMRRMGVKKGFSGGRGEIAVGGVPANMRCWKSLAKGHDWVVVRVFRCTAAALWELVVCVTAPRCAPHDGCDMILVCTVFS